MKILVLNCGSSTLKFELIETSPELMKNDQDKSLARGLVERIGENTSQSVFKVEGREPIKRPERVPDYDAAVNWSLSMLKDPETGVIKDLHEISAVGHRVVHGGETFHESTIITPQVLEKIKECVQLAPLHNPHNIEGYEVSKRFLPDIPHVAVFDTAFHARMPQVAYIYPLPYELYLKKSIRRYGFHGTSHRYVSQKGAEILGRPYSELKIITAHLGNGCSITAIDRGTSIDTSMGFTPLEGLTMGTRCGDIDPAIVTYLMLNIHQDAEKVNQLMNKKSGVLGISGLSNDMRDVEEAMEKGHEMSKLAVEIYSYRIKKYIGAYTAAMGGLDLLVFTAGVGQNSWHVRGMACSNMEFLGIKLDEAKNDLFRGPGFISTPDSKVAVLVLPTQEELMIARDTMECTLQTANA